MDNSLLNIFLILVATVGVMSALFVVVQTNVFRAAISLALSFISVAVVYFAINAEFLGAVQILVYVGAVSVLMAFSVLLVKDLQTASSSTKGFSFYTSLFISGLIFATFTYVILATNWITVENIKSPIVEQILFEEYVENSNDNSITSVSNTSLESEIKAISERVGTYNDVLICDDAWVYEDGQFEWGTFNDHAARHNHGVTREQLCGKDMSFLYDRFGDTHTFKKVTRDQG